MIFELLLFNLDFDNEKMQNALSYNNLSSDAEDFCYFSQGTVKANRGLCKYCWKLKDKQAFTVTGA